MSTLLASRDYMKERTPQEIVDDLERIGHEDARLIAALDRCYAEHMTANKPYRELFRSKLFGTIKYLLTITKDNHNLTERYITITDLDTNRMYDYPPQL